MWSVWRKSFLLLGEWFVVRLMMLVWMLLEFWRYLLSSGVVGLEVWRWLCLS